MGDPAMGLRPLYQQVREELERRLAEGRWQPGEILPSEQELAAELGVSQGTVRKALAALTDEHVLVRRQGRGTFVAGFGEARILFQFFRLRPDSGEARFPQSRVLARETGPARAAEAGALGLGPGAAVHRFERVRLLGEAPALVETIALPAARFPGFDTLPEVPNNVYRLYAERWGVAVVRASERLKAVAADAADAASLGCPEGAPLLLIDRTALDIRGAPVEFRRSRCLTRDMHYSSELR